MGGFFHRVDLKHGKMARKIGSHKRNVGGVDAPRNSLDLPAGTYKGYYSPQDDELDNYQDTDDWSETGSCLNEAPMKKLISDEISKRPKSRPTTPNIVARLMGVDTMPPDTKPVVSHDLSKERLVRSSSAGSTLSPSKSFRQIHLDSVSLSEDSDHDEWSGIGGKKSRKHKPREHPQEEELQKFKKEFEAWQTARFKECSRIVEHDSITTPDQWIAQENLNKEKLALYANSSTKIDLFEDLRKSRSFRSEEKRSFPTRRKTVSEDFEESGSYLAPTRIVILRPGFDNIINPEEHLASSSGASEDRNNIEDFLEEVKERLKYELQGKPIQTGLVKGCGIKTPYSERPSDPKQIAQRIAKQVRESVTKDFGTHLLRSESTRSYRGEHQCSGPNSPEFISRDTRRLLSDRLRNVLRKASHSNISNEDEKDENDIQSKSFRRGPDDMNVTLQRYLSPINLVRSLSAPVSGTSFGKLLLEDRHVVTGAHIQRKHEAAEKLTMKVKKHRRDKFNLKERVSSLKYSLGLRARLFGRKIHSASEFRDNDRSFVKDIMNGPTVMMNFADRPDNATEVPPSPASVCSSIHEDFHRAAYCASPITPGALTSDDNDLPQAFRDISSNLSELRKQLNQLETGLPEESVTEEQPFESEMAEELEDEDEAYIQDLLIASGLYDNSFDKSLSRFDTYAKPISSRVFDQVEESYKNKTNNYRQKSIDHMVLFDVLNEILSTLLNPPTHISKLRGKTISKLARPCCGNTLLDQVWNRLDAYLRPPVDNSFYFFDRMVARDLHSMPWSELVNDDVEALAKEVECQIMRDLITETVKTITEVLQCKKRHYHEMDNRVHSTYECE